MLDANIIFSGVVIVLFFVFAWLLFRGAQGKSDRELTPLDYGLIVLQAGETAKLVVAGIQEEWRTGALDDDERTPDAVDQLSAIYPELDEQTVRRLVKAAVYWLRLGSGLSIVKQPVPRQATPREPLRWAVPAPDNPPATD